MRLENMLRSTKRFGRNVIMYSMLATAVVGCGDGGSKNNNYDPAPIEQPSVPDVNVPDIPDVTVPNTEVPDTPDIEIPDVPDITVPDINVPETPDITVPDIPDIESPVIEEPEIPNLPEEPSVVFRITGEDLSPTGFSAKVTDFWGNSYLVKESRMEPRLDLRVGKDKGITLSDENLYYIADLSSIDKLIQKYDGNTTVTMNSGTVISGVWVPNDRVKNFYRDSGNPLKAGYLEGIWDGYSGMIKIENIMEIDFLRSDNDNASISKVSYPKKIFLDDGTQIKTDYGFIMDFCGHGWSNYYHPRMKSDLLVNDGDLLNIDLDKIKEISFKGEFNEDLPQCRNISVTYSDGKKQDAVLELTSESYGGTCNHSRRYRDFDKFYAKMDFGAVLVPLNNLKKIIPLKDKGIENLVGVIYGNWTEGDYPFTTSWKEETYPDTQGMVSVDITGTKPYSGVGSLEMVVDMKSGSTNKRNAEVFTDIRYISDYDADRAVEIQYEDGKPVGIDLSGETISARIFCPEGSGGTKHAPNGLQIFLKSMEVVGGKEVWSNYYFNWQNIWDVVDYNADPLFGRVKEGEWSKISAKIPTKGVGGLSDIPEYGVADPGFNPKRVALIGIKYGLNDKGNQDYSGKLFIDNLQWTNGANFTFEQINDPITTLVESNFNCAAILQTEYMDTPDSTNIHKVDRKSHSIEEITDLIKEMNLRGIDNIMLKPHVDVMDDSWRGLIEPSNIYRWFESYTDFIVSYAQIAEDFDVDMLVIGTELKSLIGNDYRDKWKDVVDQIRDVYSGKLTYAGNWDNVHDVCLWDLVDVVGIDAYYPLSDSQNPSKAELVKGWNSWIKEIQEFQNEVDKDIIFTEIGYRSTDYATREPWEYQEARPVNQELQLRAYEAVMEAFKGKSWFKGPIFWNYSPRKDDGGAWNTNFTPYHKLAMEAFTESK